MIECKHLVISCVTSVWSFCIKVITSWSAKAVSIDADYFSNHELIKSQGMIKRHTQGSSSVRGTGSS